MPATKTTTSSAARKRASTAKVADTSAEMEQVMTKLHTLETEVGALLERTLCETLQASGDVAAEVGAIVRQVVGSAFEATREVSQGVLQAGLRAADTGRATARDAAATVEDFGHLAGEAARQLMRGTAEGLKEVRASHRRSAAA